MKKILTKRCASGSMELSHICEEEQSGYQTEYTTTVTLRATKEDCVTLRREFKVTDYSPRAGGGGKDVLEYDIGVNELIGWIKEHGTERRR